MKLWTVQYAVGEVGGTFRVVDDDFYLSSEAEVRKRLVALGCFPISIKQRRKPLIEWWDVRSRKWQLQLLRALRFQSARISAGTALMRIIEDEPDGRRRLAFLPTRAVLLGGGSFAQALRELELFDSATLAIILAGEKAGDLKGVIAHAIEHIEEKAKQVRVIRSGLLWFVFDILSIVSTIFSIHFQFIPYLRRNMAENPDPVRAARLESAINLANVVNSGVMLVTLGVGIFAGWVYLKYRFRGKSRSKLGQKLLLQIPFVTSYLRNAGLADSCGVFSRLVEAQVPVVDALALTAETCFEPMVLSYWRDAHASILGGLQPQKALARAPMRKTEQDQLLSYQTTEDLVGVMKSVAEERKFSA